MIAKREGAISSLPFAIEKEKGNRNTGEGVVSYTLLGAWRKIEGKVLEFRSTVQN